MPGSIDRSAARLWVRAGRRTRVEFRYAVVGTAVALAALTALLPGGTAASAAATARPASTVQRSNDAVTVRVSGRVST